MSGKQRHHLGFIGLVVSILYNLFASGDFVGFGWATVWGLFKKGSP